MCYNFMRLNKTRCLDDFKSILYKETLDLEIIFTKHFNMLFIEIIE